MIPTKESKQVHSNASGICDHGCCTDILPQRHQYSA